MVYSSDMYSDIGKRTENEDSVALTFRGTALVAVMCDGLGGQGDGKIASSLVCEELVKRSPMHAVPDEDELAGIFGQANTELMKVQKNAFHRKTTAVYLCLCGNDAIWAHAGDTRLYHLYNGALCHYTLDHSAAQMSVKLGLIKREDIPTDLNRNRLLCVMGDADSEPEIAGPMRLAPGKHLFLLCTDGLWEYLTDRDIERAAADAADAKAFLSRLKDLRDRRSREFCDNHSAIAVIWEVKEEIAK